jgi:hypothetical protein
MNLLKKFHGGEEGMESIQVIMVLAAAAVIIAGVAWVWSQNKEALKTSVGEFFTFKFKG